MSSATSAIRRTARLLKEVAKDDDSPCDEDVRTFADHIGIRLPAEEDLLWIARCALKAALPPPWLPVEDTSVEPARVYYYNTVTAESCWEHPLDAYYKMFVKQERFKMVTKATSQRQQRNSEDSGTSLMSSLDDVPPLSAATSAKESDSVFHMSLRRRTASQRSRSRSCPSGLNRKSRGGGPVGGAGAVSHGHTATAAVGAGGQSPANEAMTTTTHQDDASARATISGAAASRLLSENQTSTVKIREEACVVKELTLQKKHLTAELNKLKSEVRKYQFIRERIKFSPQSEMPLGGAKGSLGGALGFSAPTRSESACQTDLSLMGSSSPGTLSQHIAPPKVQPRSSIGSRKAFLATATSNCPPILAYSTLPTTKQEHEARVSHDDLLRISERVDQLRQRHHDIALKAVQELIEDPPIAAELLQSSHSVPAPTTPPPPQPTNYPIQATSPLPEPPLDFRSAIVTHHHHHQHLQQQHQPQQQQQHHVSLVPPLVPPHMSNASNMHPVVTLGGAGPLSSATASATSVLTGGAAGSGTPRPLTPAAAAAAASAAGGMVVGSGGPGGPQIPMTSQEEWVRRLVKLRCGINECKLKQLAIK